jgi:hypothetical protein
MATDFDSGDFRQRRNSNYLLEGIVESRSIDSNFSRKNRSKSFEYSDGKIDILIAYDSECDFLENLSVKEVIYDSDLIGIHG